MLIETEWVDPRLSFSNLDNETVLNTLSARDLERLWVPEVYFLNAHDGAVRAVNKNAYAVRVGKASVGDFNAVDMGKGSTWLVCWRGVNFLAGNEENGLDEID